ncbi:hypothetical protein GHT06_017323 [Daphnia sinensis]|uniref:Uncharacterized protein n=1 Tax=Daphnia sinensis TaxID=1820382 RepID=A0AAD5L8X6_9CRUS|nr:hypothetical protein GHT06_017323 [Daphnia sinensis]
MTDGLWIYKEELKQLEVIVSLLPFHKKRNGKPFYGGLVLSHSSLGANLRKKVITSAVTPRYEERRR